MEHSQPVTKGEVASIIQHGIDGAVDSLGRMIKAGFDSVDVQLGELRQGQEDIKLRLDNAAYRFEVVELEHRVDRLEKHVGISSTKS